HDALPFSADFVAALDDRAWDGYELHPGPADGPLFGAFAVGAAEEDDLPSGAGGRLGLLLDAGVADDSVLDQHHDSLGAAVHGPSELNAVGAPAASHGQHRRGNSCSHSVFPKLDEQSSTCSTTVQHLRREGFPETGPYNSPGHCSSERSEGDSWATECNRPHKC